MAVSIKIDLNCDLGESYGRYVLGEDAAMMAWITSANVACGFHAGDPDVMAETVSLTRKNGVALGAHPGYPDLKGFGRKAMRMTPQEMTHAVCYQMGALEAIARLAGLNLVHVKPHGALYNLAAQDIESAQAIARAVAGFNPALILVGLAGSALIEAGESAGLWTANEGFPDRRYMPDGQLVPRAKEGAVISDPKEVAENALQLARSGIQFGGKTVRIDTLCLHGDNPHAVDNAMLVYQTLKQAGIEICPLRGVLEI